MLCIFLNTITHFIDNNGNRQRIANSHIMPSNKVSIAMKKHATILPWHRTQNIASDLLALWYFDAQRENNVKDINDFLQLITASMNSSHI